uniref:ribosomal protein L20 n=1 Tax=Chroothece richteriana TaxID=101928 RepID=UPI001FCD8EEC|nr:ribosomal protein L20 [Chroothece richteriana]UNJ14209.1 ribosomal protein L20 [Chroothece richteriana]
MTRIKRGNVARSRRRKIFKLAQGFRGAHSKLFRIAKQQVIKALRYSYRGRKNRKRDFRRLWITRINAASRLEGLNYSSTIANLKKANIGINRKMLSQLAIIDAETFALIVQQTVHKS